MSSLSFGLSRSTHQALFSLTSFSGWFSLIKLKHVSLFTPRSLQSPSLWNFGSTTWGTELALHMLIMCFVIAAVSSKLTMKTIHLEDLRLLVTSLAPIANYLFIFNCFTSDYCTITWGVCFNTSFFYRFWGLSAGLISLAISSKCVCKAFSISLAGFEGTTSA